MYSTCKKNCLHAEKKSSVYSFIIFLKELKRNDIKWVKRNNLITCQIVHALINKGLLNENVFCLLFTCKNSSADFGSVYTIP